MLNSWRKVRWYLHGQQKAITANDYEVMEMLAERSPQMRKAVGVLKELSADEITRMLFEKREIARMDYESMRDGALREADEKWQNIVADKDAALADKDAALADKDAALADKDALIAELRARLSEDK